MHTTCLDPHGIIRQVDKERERRAALQAEAERRLQEDQRAAESRRSAAGRADALAAFQALLVESVHSAGASWSATWPRLREDPQGRGSNALLDPRDAEDAFRAHVRHLEETAARAFAQLLDERVGVRWWLLGLLLLVLCVLRATARCWSRSFKASHAHSHNSSPSTHSLCWRARRATETWIGRRSRN